MIDLTKQFASLNPRYLHMIEKYGQDILQYDDFLKNKEYFQHGKVSIYNHCIMVTCIALEIAEKSKHLINTKALCRSALLHDYFKYDWHNYAKENGIHKLHGFYHPRIAAENAKKDFNISPLEENIIKSHMWPLGFDFPASKEAWILLLADKKCALKETLLMRK